MAHSEIAALKIISLSELYEIDRKYTEKFAGENPEEIKSVLFNLGLDTGQHYEHQVLQHRNRLNKVYDGSRWVGSERIDEQWLASGYASIEAQDKASGSRLLVDLYRGKGLTTDRASGVWEEETEQEGKEDDASN